MAEITLMHEDVYVYIDKVRENRQLISGTTALVITNDANGMVADPGKMFINIVSGNYSKVELSCNGKKITINKTLSANDVLEINLKDKLTKHNGQIGLMGGYLTFHDNTINTINVTLTGSGNVTCEYISNCVVPNNYDLMFCESLSVSKNSEHHQSRNVKGALKLVKSEKKTYSWDINVIWNDEEVSKFDTDTGYLSLRIVDIDGNVLNTLGNCLVGSQSLSSSDSSDLTCAISGECLKIF